MQVLMFSSLSEVITAMNNHTLVSHFGLEPTGARLALMNSAMTTTIEIGNALSILFLLPVSDLKGRKYAAVYLRFGITFAAALCHLLAAWFEASELYILGQLILGSHYSLRTFVTLIFVLECVPDMFRGFASTIFMFSFVFAKMIMFSAASPSLLGTSSLWFIFPIIVMISSVAVLCMLTRFPESPKWLIQQNRVIEAKDSVIFYHGADCRLNEVVTSMIREKNLTHENKLSLRQVWENDTLREAFKILLAVLFLLEFDTTYLLSVYTIVFHKTAGFSTQMAMNINLIITAISFPKNFIGTYILDAFGRRPTLFIGGLMIYSKSVSLLATQIIIYISGASFLTESLYIVVELLSALAPATGMHSIRILFVSELFPPSARTAVGQAMMFISMAINTPITTFFPIVNSIFPPIFFVPFVITPLILGTYLYRHMPETRGRAVYDIIESMDRDVGSRAASIYEEKLPLIRDRARTLAVKRNSILNTPRTRAMTFDHKLNPKN